jgi:hypothetical protein
MRKAIITTTINEPTKATKAYAQMSDWDFIVVGDTSTPHEKYKKLDGCTYLSPESQEKIDKSLSDMLGWKTIQRRNMGFIYAKNYDIIATVDDDNIPLDNWGHIFNGEHINKYTPNDIFFDPLYPTKHNHLWHRGFPLQHISKRQNYTHEIVKSPVFDVQANLWNGDPDIDAVCRMIYSPEVTFDDITEYYYSDTPGPFNSQNTILKKKVLKDYFCFDKCGRMDDIFGSYIIQKLGYKVCFGPPTVYQERNEHNVTTDMKNEYIGYENVKDILNNEDFIFKNSYNRYKELMRL